MVVLDRLRLFEKALLPLVLMAALFAITVGWGMVEFHRTVEAYRALVERNAPASLRIERLNALTDEVGYAIDRNITYVCLKADAAACARTQSDLENAAAEGEQRLDEAIRFDPAHRADYEHFRQAFRAVVAPTREAMAFAMHDENERAKAIMAPVDQRILALSDELFRYSRVRIVDHSQEGQALAASAGATQRTMIAIGALAAAVGFGVAAWIGLAELTAPIMRLCVRMAQLARGELDSPVEGQHRRDEIGEMARAVQVFKDNAHAKLQAEADAEKARAAAREAQANIARVARVLSVGELASSIAHEINQPIAAIVTNGETALRWLELEPPNADKAKAATERTIRDARRASAVVSRVRGMLAKTPPEFAVLDINAVVQDVLGFIEDERTRARVKIHARLAPHLPPVSGDPIQLQQVVLNLVMNGIQAMHANPERSRTLSIATAVRESGEIGVAIEDRGPGFDAEVAAQVFEPFFTTKESGIGLGLSISRSIIEAHGGRIWAEPASPRGAVFQFTLPVRA